MQNASTKKGLEDIQVKITIYEDNGNVFDIINDIEEIEGDFSIKYNFVNDGIYNVNVEIKNDSIGSLNTEFKLLVANKSILEDSSFIIAVLITVIILVLMIRNRIVKK